VSAAEQQSRFLPFAAEGQNKKASSAEEAFLSDPAAADHLVALVEDG
jgi:hypothetical protein